MVKVTFTVKLIVILILEEPVNRTGLGCRFGEPAPDMRISQSRVKAENNFKSQTVACLGSPIVRDPKST